MRDALLTAQTLDIFNRHAEKMGAGACAQLINCLNSLFLSHEDKFIVTPNFFVFDMYQAHQGATSVRTEFSAPQVNYQRDGQPASFWGLNGSASIKDKALTLTVVNPHATEPSEAEIVVRGGSLGAIAATVLTNSDIHAHNTFDHPDSVSAVSQKAAVSGGTVRHVFAPASVTKLSITLG
jgi:alpha-L-arabinofuranosidase